jgi:Rrf2 family nitric oxide-sensitive transcriptional repressor
MKLTLFTDLSLRVLMFLATDPARRATIAEVASVFAVSEHHLVKVVHALGKAGLLANSRGRGGGLQLAVPPERILVEDVVRLTEGPAAMADCSAGPEGRCVIAGCCKLQGVLGEAVEAFHAVLRRHTIADLVSNDYQLSRIFFAPRQRSRAAH